MVIRTLLNIFLWIVIAIIIVTGVMSFVFYKDVQEELSEGEVADQTIQEIFELSVLTSEYLVYEEERALQQWQIRYKTIGEGLSLDIFSKEEEVRILNDLRQDYDDIGEIFIRLSNLSDDEGSYVSVALRNRLLSQSLAISERMVVSSASLSREVRQEIGELQRAFAFVTFTGMFFLALIIGTGLLFMSRRVLLPLIRLSKGSAVIGRGNLDYRIDVIAEDEVGQLAEDFNQMAGKLKESYTVLEEKVRKRTKELEDAKVGLEAKVQERTLELEESKMGLEKEVARQTKQLTSKVEEVERMNQFMIGRENKMIEIKRELAEAKAEMTRLER